MGIIDILIVVALLPALYFGIKNGFVKQVVSLAVIILGIWLSMRFSGYVSNWLSGFIQPDVNAAFWLKVISFIIIFAAVAIVLNLIGKLIEKILKITLLGWLNRLLGLFFSLIKFAFLVGIIIFFIDSVNNLIHFIPEEKLAESVLYRPFLGCIKSIFPYLNSLF